MHYICEEILNCVRFFCHVWFGLVEGSVSSSTHMIVHIPISSQNGKLPESIQIKFEYGVKRPATGFILIFYYHFFSKLTKPVFTFCIKHQTSRESELFNLFYICSLLLFSTRRRKKRRKKKRKRVEKKRFSSFISFGIERHFVVLKNSLCWVFM